jgi:hypothetical protein
VKLSPEDSLWFAILLKQMAGKDDAVVVSEMRVGRFPEPLITGFLEYRQRVASVTEEDLPGRSDDQGE